MSIISLSYLINLLGLLCEVIGVILIAKHDMITEIIGRKINDLEKENFYSISKFREILIKHKISFILIFTGFALNFISTCIQWDIIPKL